ncbi:hypothetical protein [Robiginitalea sp. SC105]|uniref:hypothetical protein n=1 Tax=Robiginitalea sp. SC105 TaxID=2762332 RepID=UPI00163A8D7C|nr:hypothetical protein [Robiginitalea sp. SC105]MBC2838942.1 hypothetical protein [Robiginitalea sp. SC105]
MKKTGLALIAFLCFAGVQAQGVFKLGVVAGIASHEEAVSDFYGFVLGADAYYMFNKEDALLNLGPTVGIRNFFGDEISPGIEADDATFLPIGAAARLTILGILTGGADAGYALGLTDGLDGGFYFRPVVGLDILDILELNASYETIFNSDVNFGNINIGLLLAL